MSIANVAVFCKIFEIIANIAFLVVILRLVYTCMKSNFHFENDDKGLF